MFETNNLIPMALLAPGLVYGEPAFLAGVFVPFRVDVCIASALWTPGQPIPVFNLVSVGNDFCFCRRGHSVSKKVDFFLCARTQELLQAI